MNIAEIEESLRDLAEQRFDPSAFPYRFLEIYGAPKATVTKLRQARAGEMFGDGDVILKKRLFFRVASQGTAAATVDAMAASKSILSMSRMRSTLLAFIEAKERS